jgi:sugar phosphate isomerase/epimerase
MNFSRRSFLVATALATQTRAAGRAMQMHLSCGALGIQASQLQAIDLAARHGFDVVDADGKYLGGRSAGELQDLLGAMAAKKIGWAMAGLPVEFRRDDATFSAGLADLPAYARGLRRAGVPSVTTWVKPGSDELPYLANFKLHVARFREMVRVLNGAGLRTGIEYVAPKTAWASERYPFIHTMAEMRELIAEIGQHDMGPGNVGLVLDSWHWYHAGDSGADILALRASDVVSVDLNDAPAGVAKDQMVDGKRELPAATGIIDGKTFLQSLKRIGFAGPVRAEPFNDGVRHMSPDDAAESAAEALRKAFTAAGI